MSHCFATSVSTLAIAAAVLLPGMASAQSTKPMSHNKPVLCGAASTTQSEADCLYEARSVRRDSMAGKAAPPVSAQELAANALARCQAQPVKERLPCERMVLGMGIREGSVAQGGVVMEITTTTVGPAPAAAPL